MAAVQTHRDKAGIGHALGGRWQGQWMAGGCGWHLAGRGWTLETAHSISRRCALFAARQLPVSASTVVWAFFNDATFHVLLVAPCGPGVHVPVNVCLHLFWVTPAAVCPKYMLIVALAEWAATALLSGGQLRCFCHALTARLPHKCATHAARRSSRLPCVGRGVQNKLGTRHARCTRIAKKLSAP